MIKCLECGFECSAANVLGYHLRNHGMKYADYVVKHEHAGVWPSCKCGTLLALKKGGFNRFCSKSCASTGEDNAMGRLKGELSPNFGQKRTAEQRLNYSVGAKKRWNIHGDVLREMMQTPEYIQAQRESRFKLAEEDFTYNNRRISAMKAFWSSGSELTKQRRKEASDRAIIALKAGKIGPHAPFKTCWFDNPFTGKSELMHSSWETAFLSTCVSNGYAVTKDHDLRIPYVAHDGTDHMYVPDFVAICEKIVFEIKGLMRENDDLKLKALDEWAVINGYEVVLVREG